MNNYKKIIFLLTCLISFNYSYSLSHSVNRTYLLCSLILSQQELLTTNSLLFEDSNNLKSSDTGLIKQYDTIITYFNKKKERNIKIYENGILYRQLFYYKKRIIIEGIFENGIEVKRKIYYNKKPYGIKTIGFYKNDKWIKSEFYNKKGKLIKIEQ